MALHHTRANLLDDPWLGPYHDVIRRRSTAASERARRLADQPGSLAEFACAHEYYGLHPAPGGGWVFREWAPRATGLWLVGDFSGWEARDPFRLERLSGRDVWEVRIPSRVIRHGHFYRLEVAWPGGRGERIPAYARRVTQDPVSGIFTAQVWDPPELTRGGTRSEFLRAPLIYETHIGMAQEACQVGTYDAFRRQVLPRIIDAGYNTIQVMAVMEHPYYASFGYQVSSFFAASSRFGTPEELKMLIDDAHGAGLTVVMDLVHSHAVKNEREGLSRFDGTQNQYFHDGLRGWHDAWDSRCFDYGKTDVLHFLLSNCRYWLDEFHFDGFRFDGITSMLYMHHGLGVDFTDYSQYFDPCVDEDAWIYCNLANRLIHELRPDAITIAEDVSGMPGLAAPVEEGGAGFDFRMAMGVPECWLKLARDVRDEDWSIGYLWHELTNRRLDERTVNYVESHDQALVGGKTLLFQLMDAAMYDSMARAASGVAADRGVALHKLARLATLATAGAGYLNFMGNEFGHPEWIDFPREGNGNSYLYARRQWNLRDDSALLFSCLGDFDREMLRVATATGMLVDSVPRLLHLSEADKVLVLERGPLLVMFNFHSTCSVRDYPVRVPPGQYRGILNSDELRFGGQGRITVDQVYPLLTETRESECVFLVRVYLPCRTALLLAKP